MTATEVALLITAGSGALGAIGAFIVSIRSHREVKQVKEATNGLVAALGEARRAQGDAEGHERGLKEGRAEH